MPTQQTGQPHVGGISPHISFETMITARHSAEETAVIRSLYGYGEQPEPADPSVPSGRIPPYPKDGDRTPAEAQREIIVRYRHGEREAVMIGKIKKGKSFGGCIRYVMGKDNAEIIDSDGVLLGNIREITDSFNYQRGLIQRSNSLSDTLH